MQWEEIEDLMASSDEDPVESEGDIKEMRKSRKIIADVTYIYEDLIRMT